MKVDATVRLRVLAVCIIWMFPFSALSADESVSEILTKVSEAYRTLQSYELVADISTEVVAAGDARSPDGGRATSNFHKAMNSEVDLAAVGPEKVRLQVKDERHEVLVVSDGVTRWTYLPRKKQYTEAAATTAVAGESRAETRTETELLSQNRDLLVGRYQGILKFRSKFILEKGNVNDLRHHSPSSCLACKLPRAKIGVRHANNPFRQLTKTMAEAGTGNSLLS
jgi:outer membrane lipoprotein-sorting protein